MVSVSDTLKPLHSLNSISSLNSSNSLIKPSIKPLLAPAMSNIPVLNRSDYLNHLLAVGDSLKAKSRVELPVIAAAANGSASAADLEALNKGKLEVQSQLDQTKRFADELDAQYKTLRRAHRHLDLRRADLLFQVSHWESIFDRKSTSVTQSILNHERMAELLLRQLRQKLDDDFNNHRFHVQNDVLAAANFDDTEAIHEIDNLKQEKSQLENALSECLHEQNEAVRAEVSANKMLLATLQKEKKALLNKLAEDRRSAETAFAAANGEVAAMDDQIRRRNDEIDRILGKIALFRHSMNNAESIRRDLDSDLQDQLAELDRVQAEVESIKTEKDGVFNAYAATEEKSSAYVRTLTVLENAIFRLQSSTCAFLLLHHDCFPIQSEHELVVNGKLLLFTRIFSENVLDQLHSHVALFAAVDTVSFVFTGFHTPPLHDVVMAVAGHLRKRQESREVQAQCLLWKNNDFFDVLANETPAHVQTEPVLNINSTKITPEMLPNVTCNYDCATVVHLSTEKRSAVFIDISKLPLETQTKMMENPSDNGAMDKLLQWSRANRMVTVISPSATEQVLMAALCR